MKIKLFLHVSILISIILSSVTIKAETVNQHVSVSINELMLNAFFESIGDVKGKGSTKVIGRKVKYTWKVKDPIVDIEPGTAIFKANVDIKSGKIKTSKKAKGKLNIKYIKEKNIIRIVAEEIKVSLSIKLFGKKVKLGTLDLSKFYKPSFEFSGPMPIQNSIEIDKPDGTKHVINISTENEKLILEKNKISVYSNLTFTTAE